MFFIGRKKLILILTVVVFAPSAAHALTMDYYTYNGFDSILDAFNKASLVLSDPQYGSLMYLMAGVGFTASALNMGSGMQSGVLGRYTPLGKHLTGTVIYLSLFAPSAAGTLILYDATLNRGPQAVAAPDGVVFIAGYSNLIQRAITEIFGTSADPLGYEQSAAGVGPKLLMAASEVATNGVNPAGDPYMQMNIKAYSDNCFKTAMLTSPNFDLADFKMKTTDFMPALELGATASWDTLIYSKGAGAGTTTSCADAWNSNIKPWLLTAASFNYMRDVACGKAGYDPADPKEGPQCSNIISAWVPQVSGQSVGSVNYLRQVMLANLIASTVEGGSAAPQANSGITSQAWGLGQVYSEWAPALINFVTMLAIMMIPLFVLLLPTPWMNTALEGIAAVFVWVMFWTLFDFILHQGAIQASNKLFTEIKDNGIAYASVMAMPTAASKSYAIWTLARSSAGLLATLATGFFFKQMGHVAGMVAGQLTAPISAAGSSAGSSAYTPQGMADNLQRSSSSVAGLSGGASLGMQLFQQSAANNALSPVMATASAANHMGGVGHLTGATARGQAQNMVKTGRTAERLNMDDMETQAGAGAGMVKGQNRAYGNDAETARQKSENVSAKKTLRDTAMADSYDEMAAKKGIGGDRLVQDVSDINTQKGAGDSEAFANIAGEHGMTPEALGNTLGSLGYERNYQGVLAAEKKANAAGMTLPDYLQAEQRTGTYADASGERRQAVGTDGKKVYESAKSGFSETHEEINKDVAEQSGKYDIAKVPHAEYFEAGGRALAADSTSVSWNGNRYDVDGIDTEGRRVRMSGTGAGLAYDDKGRVSGINNFKPSTTNVDKGRRETVADKIDHLSTDQSGRTKSETVDVAAEKHSPVFDAAGTPLIGGTVKFKRDGDLTTIEGVGYDGYHYQMKGASSGLAKDGQGAVVGAQDFHSAEKTAVRRDDKTDSAVVADMKKLNIDHASDVKFSNLGNIMSSMGYGDSREDLERFGKEHPAIIGAYGGGKNVMENFNAVVKGYKGATSFGTKEKPSTNKGRGMDDLDNLLDE